MTLSYLDFSDHFLGTDFENTSLITKDWNPSVLGHHDFTSIIQLLKRQRVASRSAPCTASTVGPRTLIFTQASLITFLEQVLDQTRPERTKRDTLVDVMERAVTGFQARSVHQHFS